MTRKQLFVLIGCMIVGIGLLVSLFALSPIGSPIVRQPFSRIFSSRLHLMKVAEIDLGLNSFYIAGATKKTIYFGNFTAPLYLKRVSLPQLDTQHQILHVKDIQMPGDYTRFRLSVDSPYFYLTHGVMPAVFKGTLDNGEVNNFLPVNSPYFTDAVPINPNLFALKSLSQETNSAELATLRPDSPYFEFKPDVLVKQVDGIFCVDGKLHYNKDIDKLVYVYNYRNQFIVMDTGLNVTGRYHTIDTFSVAPIKVANVDSKKYSTLASPPVNINGRSWVSGKFLFVQSPLLAKNEDVNELRKGFVIDAYDIVEGKYLYSFYMDFVDGRGPSSLMFTSQYVVAIFGQKLIIFKHDVGV